MKEVVCYENDVDVIGLSDDKLDELEQSSDLWLILGTQHEILYANTMWYQWHDLKRNQFDVAGKVYSEVPHKAYVTCTKEFEEHDQLVITEKKTVPSIEIHDYKFFNGRMAIYSETIPIIKDGQVEKLCIRARKLPSYYLSKVKKGTHCLFSKNNDINVLLKNPDNMPDACFDTVYLFMLGLKSKDIAHYRKVSESTVRNTLVNVRIRLGLDKCSDIIEYAAENQWYQHIPNLFRAGNVSIANKNLGAGKLFS